MKRGEVFLVLATATTGVRDFVILNPRISPPSRRGGRADLSDVSLPSELGAAGEVKPLVQYMSDLPRRAEFSVAKHLLDRRGSPLLEGGDMPPHLAFQTLAMALFYRAFKLSRQRK